MTTNYTPFSNPNSRIPTHRTLSRRRFLIYSGLGAAALGVSACVGVAPTAPTAATPASIAPLTDANDLLEFMLTARQNATSILPGAATQTLGYVAEVLQGDAGAVTALPDSYLGPIVRVTRGQTVRVHVRNELDEPTNVHWHGLIVPRKWMASPATWWRRAPRRSTPSRCATAPARTGSIPIRTGARRSRPIAGLAGLFIVTDAEERRWGCPPARRTSRS
jgi:FtsP/CotA-like multicopper oxidase with cupredoxin domain